MRKEILLDSWNRKEHFQFFSGFEEPYFGLVTDVDCTKAYKRAKAQKVSFFLYYLYQSLRAVNQVEAFRYRIENEKVYCYNQIHASPTISRDDHTFGFSFFEYKACLSEFIESASQKVAAVQQSSGLGLNAETGRIDVIHYSAVPWVRFTGLTHARSFTYKDSVPKISFGKYHKEGEKLLLPVAVYVHHGLMDAYHVGQFLEVFGDWLNEE